MKGIVSLCFLAISVTAAQHFSIENARSIVITSGGAIKFIVGLSVPIELPMPVSLNFIQNIQFQYMMVSNATQLSYMNLLRSTRSTAYKALAQTWNNLGINGTDCILQVICDIGKHPLSHNGVLGEIVDTIFTPHKSSENIYQEAMMTGKEGKDCKKSYSFCKETFLDYFTKIK